MGRLSLIQVGAGLFGRSWAELVRRTPGFELAALVDGAEEARAWAVTTLGVPAYGTLGEAIDRTEADAVLLVTPPETHRPLAEQALAAGAHVLSEKPFALSIADASAVLDASVDVDRHVMVAHNYRFRRQPRALNALVSAGELGRLLGIRVTYRRDLRNAWISRNDWRGKMAHPLLLDMAIHHIDLLRLITGSEIVAVDARGWKVPDSPFRGVPTIGALLTLDGGTPVAYEGSWASGSPETSWNGDWEMIGERGRATWTGGVRDHLRGTVRFHRYGSEPERVATPRLSALDRAGVLAAFRASIDSGTPPETSLEDHIKSLGAILALARSIEEGRPVTV